MSKKRFMIDDSGELIDLSIPKFIDYGDEVCELLNEFNDENVQLKSELIRTKIVLSSLHDKYSGLLKLVHGVDKND